jgi:hypothetical protein
MAGMLTPVVLTREGSPNQVCKQMPATPKKITTFPMMRVSTGIPGLDQTIDMLRLGDNVVWQVQSIEDYLQAVNPYILQAKKDGRRLV